MSDKSINVDDTGAPTEPLDVTNMIHWIYERNIFQRVVKSYRLQLVLDVYNYKQKHI